MNETGTVSESGTRLTQAGSPPVHGRTLGQLIHEYRTDQVSRYRKLRYATRVNHDNLMNRMVTTYGDLKLSDIKARTLEEMHLRWSNDGRTLATAHSFMSKLRALCGYGAGMLDDPDCTRICISISQRRDPASGERNNSFLTLDQCVAIREKARQIGYFSIALAQAIQFDTLLRQKDCLGELVPLSEPGEGIVTLGDKKWQRGITWEEIGPDLVLNHVTSKKQKRLILPLIHAPQVVEEFKHVPDWQHDAGGPVIICEHTSYPWDPSDFRRRWRSIADLCGVPKEVKNMHSRSGGISEGIKAGVPIEFMRHAAKHSDVQMTAHYDRNEHEIAAEALRRRAAARAEA
ncbi:hypothetical protein ACVWZ4_007212 [Bradyrhizobium sp. USDA 4472]